MQGGQILAEEPIKLSSVLTYSKLSLIPSLTKIVGTLGPKSRSVQVIEACLKSGMSVARFDFSGFDMDYHQETIDSLKIASRKSNKLCAVMLDTVGPGIQVYNKNETQIELKVDDHLTITSDPNVEPSAEIVPVNYPRFSENVKKGDTIFLGQYLFTGIETTSVWLEVLETKGQNVICLVKNSATLRGFMFTIHVSRVHIDLPTLTDYDKKVISSWGFRNKVDIIALSHTRRVEDVLELRAFLKEQAMHETQIFAKIETIEGLKHFDDILGETDGIILSRGNLGIDLPPEKVFLFQKSALFRCNMVGKTAIVTRVVDSMTENLRPTRAEATDVANAVLDGSDGILLAAETLRGLYPIEAIKTVGRICAEAESVYNQPLHFKRALKYIGEHISQPESVAASAVGAAIKVRAAMIIVFTSSGGAVRLVAKYRPTMPIFAIVIPRIQTNSLKWTFTSSSKVRQLLGVRGVYPILANPSIVTSGESSEESGLKLAYAHGKSLGILKPNDQIVVFQKSGDSSAVKMIEYEG